MTEIIIITLLLLTIFLIALYVMLSQNKRSHNSSETEISELIKQNNELDLKIRTLTDLFNGNHDRLNNSINEVKDKINEKVQEELKQSREKTHEDLTKLSERLAVIDNAQKNITDLSNNGDGMAWPEMMVALKACLYESRRKIYDDIATALNKETGK